MERIRSSESIAKDETNENGIVTLGWKKTTNTTFFICGNKNENQNKFSQCLISDGIKSCEKLFELNKQGIDGKKHNYTDKRH